MNKPSKPQSRGRSNPGRADIRLLPAVIAVGGILFALKAGGLALTASAAPSPAAPAAAPPAKSSAAQVASPRAGSDPLAAINAALPMPAKPVARSDGSKPPDELNADLAASGVSSAEMDVLTSLADRREVLETRQRELDLRTNIIAATEKRVDDKITQLKSLQARIEALLGQRDAKETEQLDSLVKVYTAMKPKDAARIFSALDDSVRIGVAGRMKPDIMAGILAALPAEVAQKLTFELASRYKALADLPAAPISAAAAQPSAPPVAAAGPPPVAGAVTKPGG
jgi:flagellar motility protein MotE (MotC chaperone)